MIWSDDGGGKEKVRSSGGRSFQRRGAVTDMANVGYVAPFPFALVVIERYINPSDRNQHFIGFKSLLF